MQPIVHALVNGNAAAEVQPAKVAAKDCSALLYGKLSLNTSQEQSGPPRIMISSLLPAQEGETVHFRARVNASRAHDAKANAVLLNLRQRTYSIQVRVVASPQKISDQMVKWASAIPDESIVVVEGIVQIPKEEVKGASITNVEILISQIHVVISPETRLPFSVQDASRGESDFDKEDNQVTRVLLDTRLNNRILDLRTPTNQALFSLKSTATKILGSFLRSHGFTEIHSPKLKWWSVENDDSDFKVNYFKGTAYLSQSHQFAKQMCIAADFERVFEFGPVFRAGNENTHRHVTEFIALGLEMTFEYDYHEGVDFIDQLLLSFFRGLKEQCAGEIELIQKQFPTEEFKWRDGPEGTLKLTFKEASDLLVQDGVVREATDDINMEDEKRLGRIIKKKYDTDYYIVEKFPAKLRAFYSMPDSTDPTLSNSFDFFMRGEEILSGAERIHEPTLLVEKLKEKDIDPSAVHDYIDAFKLGCPPHVGCGIGLERIIMLFLRLDNIRRASLFPRDPTRLKP